MGFTIVYDKQFIKAEKNGEVVFIPMVYAGSSNCFEVGLKGRSGRRERSWCLMTHCIKGKKYATLEEIIKGVENVREEVIASNKENSKYYIEQGKPDFADEYSDERFGYFNAIAIGTQSTVNTTFGHYKGLYVTGCRKALTIEELNEIGVFPSIQILIFDDTEKELFDKIGIPTRKSVTPKTSKELIELIDEFEASTKDFKKANVYISCRADERKMREVRREYFPKEKKQKKRITVDKFFVIKDETDNHYVYSISKYGYRYSLFGRSRAKTFLSKKGAERYAKKIAERIDREFVIEEIKETVNMMI